MNKKYIKINYSSDYNVHQENLQALGVYYSTDSRELLNILFDKIIPENTEANINALPDYVLHHLYNNCYWVSKEKTSFSEFINELNDYDLYHLLTLEYTDVEILEIIAPAVGYEFNTLYGYNEFQNLYGYNKELFTLYPKGADVDLIGDLIFNINFYDIIIYNENMEVVDTWWGHYPVLSEYTVINAVNDYIENAEIGGIIVNEVTDDIKFDKLKLVRPIPVKYEFKEV